VAHRGPDKDPPWHLQNNVNPCPSVGLIADVKVKKDGPSASSLKSKQKYSSPSSSSRKVLGERDCVNQKRKLSESGIFGEFASRNIVLFFENLPVWLLSLRPTLVKKLCFPQWESRTNLLHSLRRHKDGILFNACLAKFDESSLTFKANVCTGSLILISGSLDFYSSILHLLVDEQSIYILDRHQKLRKIPTFSPRLRRFKHSSVGGATKLETFYSMLGIHKTPELSSIQRDISSYLDYSIREITPISSGATEFTHQFDRLHPNQLHAKIVVTSDFSHSGFGTRRLSQFELGAIYGVPSIFFEALQHAEFTFLPVQILDSLLLCGLDLVTTSRKRARQMIPIPKCSIDEAPTYLSALDRLLPPTWHQCDVTTQKAAKDDDADIDFNKWDLRILSLWPQATALIPTLRSFLLRWQFRRLYKEYRLYLRRKFRIAYILRLFWYSRNYWGLFSNQLRGVLARETFIHFEAIYSQKNTVILSQNNNTVKTNFRHRTDLILTDFITLNSFNSLRASHSTEMRNIFFGNNTSLESHLTRGFDKDTHDNLYMNRDLLRSQNIHSAMGQWETRKDAALNHNSSDPNRYVLNEDVRNTDRSGTNVSLTSTKGVKFNSTTSQPVFKNIATSKLFLTNTSEPSYQDLNYSLLGSLNSTSSDLNNTTSSPDRFNTSRVSILGCAISDEAYLNNEENIYSRGEGTDLNNETLQPKIRNSSTERVSNLVSSKVSCLNNKRKFDTRKYGINSNIENTSLASSLDCSMLAGSHLNLEINQATQFNSIHSNSAINNSTAQKIKKVKFENTVLDRISVFKRLSKMNSELIVGRDCLNSYLGSSFFGWDKGSALLYWRWSQETQIFAREGFQPFISGKLPNTTKKASTPKQPVFDKIYSKIKKALQRNYLKLVNDPKQVHNVIDYFGVAKGESDVRVVFNGTSCGLNDAVWAPNFWLPTAKSMVRALNFNFKSVDIDLGEMFLNFPLSKKLIAYSGVDISPFRAQLKNDGLAQEVNGKLIATWSRTWMGFRPSPEWACRFYYIAEEFVRGNEKDVRNPLYWKKVIFNLIGSEGYNPALPNVYKWNDLIENIAGEIKAYVDDLRVIGINWEHAWAIARLVASRLQFLGIQDAPRKRRTDNGAWAGTIYLTTPNSIQTTVSVTKWLKGRKYIDHLNQEIKDNPDVEFDFKLLEQIRGYLCHLAMTYEILFPYLKGFHLTLCSHLPKRSEEGWKMSDLEWLGFMQERLESGKLSAEQHQLELNKAFDPKNQPKRIRPVERFFRCLKALTKFFELEVPPIITHRSTNVRLVAYGFVDASKGGFGASIDYGKYTKYRVGVWGVDTDADSSNFREFANLVETLEAEDSVHKSLNNVTMIIATDNSTVEAALYKGNSSSEKLFDLIVRLRMLELRTGGKFIVTHVSGDRMKRQGTDGISRGQLSEGISIGEYMLQFCPWNETALERSRPLKDWIVTTFGKECEFLEPADWFQRAHDHLGGYSDGYGYWRLKTRPGTYVWTPPPAAADAALEELRKARLKRRQSTHLFLVPRLATTLWLKQLNKACDLVIYLPNHFSFWPSSMHEPLVLGVCYPYLHHRPWQLRGSPKLFALGREMRTLLKDPEVDAGSVLLKLHAFCRRLPSMQKDVVWSLLQFRPKCQFPHTSVETTKRKRTD